MKYTCPMHPEVQSETPSRCPKCGMKLVDKHAAKTAHHHSEHEHEHDAGEAGSYTPLIIILSIITLVTAALAAQSWLNGTFEWSAVMSNFMAGFFIVFSGFKLLDLNGFAEGYSTYDLIAQKVFSYGYVYPFLELFLGIAYALHIDSPLLHAFTFVLMLVSGAGVALKLSRHEQFQCACLGTFLKVPLTKVTLVEDFGMAAMALLMLM